MTGETCCAPDCDAPSDLPLLVELSGWFGYCRKHAQQRVRPDVDVDELIASAHSTIVAGGLKPPFGFQHR